MIVKLNGKEVYRMENSDPGVYKNVIVSNSFEEYEGSGDYYDDDTGASLTYEDYYGEFPLSDVSIMNLHLKSYEF